VGDPHEHPAEEAPDRRLCDRLEGILDIGLAGEVQQLLRTRPSELHALPRELAR
jgi:hypothetical protein